MNAVGSFAANPLDARFERAAAAVAVDDGQPRRVIRNGYAVRERIDQLRVDEIVAAVPPGRAAGQIKHPTARAHDPVVRERVRQSEARRKQVPRARHEHVAVGAFERDAVGGQLREERGREILPAPIRRHHVARSRPLHEEVRSSAVRCLGIALKVVAESEIRRHLRRDLPGVFDEARPDLPRGVRRRVGKPVHVDRVRPAHEVRSAGRDGCCSAIRQASQRAGDGVQQHLGHAGAAAGRERYVGEGARVAVPASRRGRLEEVGQRTRELEAPLPAVIARELAERRAELIGTLKLDARQIVGDAELAESVDGKQRQPTHELTIRRAQPEPAGNGVVGSAQWQPLVVDRRIPEPRLADQRGRIDAGPAERAAVDLDRLIAAAELRTVDDAAIRGGHQRRIARGAEPAEHLVVVVEVLIDSHVALMIVILRDRVDGVVAGQHVGPGRVGKFLQQSQSVLIHAIGGDPVGAGRVERIANPRRGAGRHGPPCHWIDRTGGDQSRCRRIEDRPQREGASESVRARAALQPDQVRHICKVAVLHAWGRCRQDRRRRLSRDGAFVIDEEERFLVAAGQETHRATEREPELIAEELPFLQTLELVEEVDGIHRRVAIELEHVAAILIAARLEAGVQHGAGRAPELGAVAARLNPELLQRVDRGAVHITRAVDEVDEIRVVVDAVEEVVVGEAVLAVRGEAAVAAHSARILLRLDDAWVQLREEGVVAPVQRQLVDRLRLHDAAERRFLRLERRRVAGDVDRLGDVTRLQREVADIALLNAER